MVIWYSRGDEWRIFVHVAGIGRQVLKRVMAVVGNSQHAKHGMRSQDIEKWLGGSILHFAICDISSLIPSSDLNSVHSKRGELPIRVLCFRHGPKDFDLNNASQWQSRQRGLVPPSPRACIDVRHPERSSYRLGNDLGRSSSDPRCGIEVVREDCIEDGKMQSVGI